MGKKLGITSVEPEDEGLRGGVLGGLEEPVKEGPPGLFVDGDVAGVMGEADIEGLPRQLQHPVLLPDPRGGGPSDAAGAVRCQQENKEESGDAGRRNPPPRLPLHAHKQGCALQLLLPPPSPSPLRTTAHRGAQCINGAGRRKQLPAGGGRRTTAAAEQRGRIKRGRLDRARLPLDWPACAHASQSAPRPDLVTAAISPTLNIHRLLDII